MSEDMALEFITVEDCSTDNILTCEESDITYANSYLETLALGFGLAEDEIAKKELIILFFLRSCFTFSAIQSA
jgi:hypothetical protein